MTNTSLRLEHNQARNRRNITITCCKKTPMFPLSQAKSTNYLFLFKNDSSIYESIFDSTNLWIYELFN